MYIISKLFTYLFLPPSIFIWGLIIAAIVAKRFKFVFITLGIIFYLLSIKPISNLLLSPLEDIPTSKHKADIVVVLSGGSNPNDILKSAPDAFKRLTYGIILAKQKNIPLIFTGGGDKPSEADNAKKDIELFEKTFNFRLKTYYEDKALDTVENAKYTKELIKKEHLSNKIYLVTSAYHMKRSIIIFKHFGFEVIAKPVGFIINNKNYNFYDFLPHMSYLMDSYKAIHEYFGILSLLLRGYSLNVK